jgi:preprotein translocase subunit SecG
MVQNPKGGGLSSTFGSSSTMGGVQKNNRLFLDKKAAPALNSINIIIKSKLTGTLRYRF